MIVAFFGPSSSGKSTLLKEIKKKSFFSGKKTVLKREDDFITIFTLKRILGYKLFSDYKRVKFFEKKSTGSLKIFSLLVHFFYPILVYLEFFFEYLYYEILFKKKILMRERYIYDYLVTFKDILKISNRLLDFFYKMFPKPSLLFFVSINKETAMKRNKNNIPNKITAKESFQINVLKLYSEIAKAKNILTIDNNGPLKKSLEKIKFHICAQNKLLKIRSIAISGLDGSGKTALSRAICNYAAQLNVKCKVVHFYHDNMVYKFLKTLGFFKTSSDSIPKEFIKRKKTSLWAFLTWIDSYLQYLFAMIFFSKNLIIFDRYFYDYLITFKYHNVKGIQVFEKIIPPVGYKLLVACDPAVALKRKPENTVDFFVLGSKGYTQLAKTYNMKVIDSTSRTNEAIFKQFIYDIVNNEL